MTQINKVIEFIYYNIGIVRNFYDYANYCINQIQPVYKLTIKEYISLVSSYEFNKLNYENAKRTNKI